MRRMDTVVPSESGVVVSKLRDIGGSPSELKSKTLTTLRSKWWLTGTSNWLPDERIVLSTCCDLLPALSNSPVGGIEGSEWRFKAKIDQSWEALSCEKL